MLKLPLVVSRHANWTKESIAFTNNKHHLSHKRTGILNYFEISKYLDNWLLMSLKISETVKQPRKVEVVD